MATDKSLTEQFPRPLKITWGQAIAALAVEVRTANESAMLGFLAALIIELGLTHKIIPSPSDMDAAVEGIRRDIERI